MKSWSLIPMIWRKKTGMEMGMVMEMVMETRMEMMINKIRVNLSKSNENKLKTWLENLKLI